MSVVPLVGTWIETRFLCQNFPYPTVVPLVGTWIETYKVSENQAKIPSFPLWERGLKPLKEVGKQYNISVVPLVGTWIETLETG